MAVDQPWPLMPTDFGGGVTASSAGGAAASQGLASGLSGLGPVMALIGTAQSAVGSFYAAKGQQYELKSKASGFDFDATISDQNARRAELDAQQALRSGQQQAGYSGLRYAAAKSAQLASQGASGVEVGVGSTAEVLASTELAKQMDAMTIDANAARAAAAQRTEGVNYTNRAALDRVSAANLRNSAGSIKPWAAAFTSLLGSAGQVAPMWIATDNRGLSRSTR